MRFLAVLGIGVLAFLALQPSCAPIPVQPAERGSHGYRIWSGPTLRSFTHQGERICIPAGWEPIGHTRAGHGWAAYPQGTTGVVMRSDAFASRMLTFTHSAYQVTLRYPTETLPTELEQITTLVTNAFERTGALFPDTRALDHTVIVTAGVPAVATEDESVYPDQTPDVSYLILGPSHPRSEELFTHAVVHLYNRHRPDLMQYQRNQKIPAAEWQELEASWAETAFRTSPEGRAARLAYLYAVHAAVLHGEPLTVPPFTDRTALTQMRTGLVNEDSSYLEQQYAHYVLAPLIMVGIDSLLTEYRTGATVEELLIDTHANDTDFFARLTTLLPSEEITRIERWIAGTEAVP